jgi:hypothetical protein
MAARVEDLPEPVGPVTSINPCGLLQKDFIDCGKFSDSIVGMVNGIFLKTREVVPLWRNILTLNLPIPRTE